jgi:hypothetical protein
MARIRDEIIESRRQLKAEYKELLRSMAALLYRHDPIGINFGDNPDEYELEAETILTRLRSCQSVNDVLQIVHAEFVCWFASDTAGPPEHYKKIASEVWQLWQKHLADSRKQPGTTDK